MQTPPEDTDLLQSLVFGEPYIAPSSLPPTFTLETDVAAWTDSDNDEQVDIQTTKRLRKLKTSFDQVDISHKEFQKRLRAQFEKLNPTPEWTGSNVETLDLLSRTNSLVSRGVLTSPDRLHVLRLKDANISEYSNCVVQTVQFHPTLPVLITAGFDKALRFFQIDGVNNPKLQTVVLKGMQVYNAHCTGSSVVLTGRKNFVYYYDLESGETQQVFGIRGFLNVDVGRQEKSFERSVMSKCTRYMAVIGRDGYVILVSMVTRQWCANLKINGVVADVAFSNDGQSAYVLAEDGIVSVFDMETKKQMWLFQDHGCVKATCIAVSDDGAWVSVGQTCGIVNVYTLNSCRASSTPTPAKAIASIVTPISLLKFHPSGQILALCSRVKKDAMRLFHLPTLRVVKNWPTANTPLGNVSSLDFSPDCKYIAVGNAKGKALLYQLLDF